METTIYYGMSGTFKLTTIKNTDGEKILSWNKTLQKYSNLFLKKDPSDLDLALLRMVQLKEYPWDQNKTYLIERGITDFLEYHTSAYRADRWNPDFVEPWIEEENKILGIYIHKVLLIMNDYDFIETNILNDPWRSKHLGSLESYLKRQDEYIKFTEYWNKINEEIIINDAQDYLLKLKK